MDIKSQKKELRKLYKQKRAAVLSENRENISSIISEKLFSLEEYRNSDIIFTFIGTPSEILTDKIIAHSLNNGKKVAVPVVTDKAHEMIFTEINKDTPLIKSKMGILEPAPDISKQLTPTPLSVIIVPALAVGRDLYRIGYGGGYYDKFLSENNYLSAIALCTDTQLIPSVPHNEFDIKTDIIITEKEIIK
ncbi:MAG: 5-formyltetrahydrofolate cyclo-ligase [Firmicutes bacterium]|nr:5-formyltetrahydrofolate cyclo-ligase [Bacillota bacterium]